MIPGSLEGRILYIPSDGFEGSRILLISCTLGVLGVVSEFW